MVTKVDNMAVLTGKKVQDMSKSYSAEGIVWGRLWGGGKGGYAARKLYATSKSELYRKIENALDDGSLDSGMGYEHLLGAVMVIITKTTITVGGDLFTNESSYFEDFGDVPEDIVNELEEQLLFE